MEGTNGTAEVTAEAPVPTEVTKERKGTMMTVLMEAGVPGDMIEELGMIMIGRGAGVLDITPEGEVEAAVLGHMAAEAPCGKAVKKGGQRLNNGTGSGSNMKQQLSEAQICPMEVDVILPTHKSSELVLVSGILLLCSVNGLQRYQAYLKFVYRWMRSNFNGLHSLGYSQKIVDIFCRKGI